MKAFKSFPVVLIIIAVGISGCKKYPDGPLFSLYTRQHRVVGTWHVQYFSINGYDSTEYLKSNPLYGSYQFSKSRHGGLNFVYLSNDYRNSAEGNWSFDNNDEYIKIDVLYTIPENKHLNIGPLGFESARWHIQRLKENEMWLKNNYSDGREYFVKFKHSQN
jgi:hypothetical protein